MRGMQRPLCFPEALQILLMRDGKLPSRPAPKALDDTDKNHVFNEYTLLEKHLLFSRYCPALDSQVLASLEQISSGEHELVLAGR